MRDCFRTLPMILLRLYWSYKGYSTQKQDFIHSDFSRNLYLAESVDFSAAT